MNQHTISQLGKVEKVARDTANRLVISFDPIGSTWRVTVGLYQAEARALDTALNAIVSQRSEFQAKQR